MAGFGRSPFGRGPFGRSNVGRDLIIQSFPVEYFDDSLSLPAGQTPQDNTVDPLLMVLKTYAHQISNRRIEVQGMLGLLDPETMPLSILGLWAEMLGLGIDKNDPEFLQRSLLANASQWLQIKASIPGYEVRGLASGFTVQIENYWRMDEVYAPLIPDRFKFYFKPKLADDSAVKMLHTSLPPGTYAGTPTVEDKSYAKSSYLRCIFEVAEPRRTNVDYNALLDLVIYKILDVVGLHHELLPSVFQIHLNVNARATSNFESNEFSTINANQNAMFDITPADLIPTDQVMSVTMTTGHGFEIDANSLITVDIETSENEVDLVLPVPVGATSNLIELDESLVLTAQGQANASVVIATVWGVEVSPSVSILMDDTEQSTSYVIETSVTPTLTQFDESGKLSVSESISISKTFTEASKMGATASISSLMKDAEKAIFSISETVRPGFNQLSESGKLSVSESISISKAFSEASTLGATASISSLMKDNEKAIFSISETVTPSLTQNESAKLSASESISISKTFSESATLGATASITCLIKDAEQSNASVIETGITPVMTLLSESARPSVAATQNILFRTIQTVSKINVPFNGSVSVVKEQENTQKWQINQPLSAGLLIRETPNLALDALRAFDLSAADVWPLDSSGYVTISITTNP